jgi:hypothetical protein
MAITRNRTADYMNVTPSEVKIVDGVAVKYRDVVVHEFLMGDVDDPEIHIAAPIWEWQQSPAGAWIMEHAVEKPYWHNQVDLSTYGYRCTIVARLSEADEVFFRLKYVGTKSRVY